MFLDDKAHERFLDILFENRNKSYGAFFLRRTYSMRVLAGMLVSIGAIVLIALSPYIADWLRPRPEFDANVTYIPVTMDDFSPPPGQLSYVPKIQEPENTIPKVIEDSVPPEPKEIIPPQPDNTNKTDTSGTSSKPPGGGGPEDNGPFYGEGVNSTAVPPGGKGGSIRQITEDWRNYVIEHLRYPPDAKRKGIKGTVEVVVDIAKDGSVKNVRIKKGLTPELDKAALDMIQAMPKWSPAIVNGYPKVQPLTLTLTFDPMNIK